MRKFACCFGKICDKLSPDMLPIYNLETAKQTILKRTPLALQEVPAEMLDRIEALFGERLTPAQAVAHILEDVRVHRDEALKRWTEKLDGVSLPDIRVSTKTIQQALQNIPSKTLQALQEAASG